MVLAYQKDRIVVSSNRIGKKCKPQTMRKSIVRQIVRIGRVFLVYSVTLDLHGDKDSSSLVGVYESENEAERAATS